ncbi:hypothetical protein [Flavobacterium xueshanense]|uniref:Uncharacterized protein n=1 Tax=Flavobacterium xueshanense TaxID=935223 RepID=A0A1I2DH35_9FLAO|nr:hypothetical protein [Flavobacterium xueshanense]SFE79836.1 hypothetical protein SAMN04488131_10470 [Flavobacterium xueshanense]
MRISSQSPGDPQALAQFCKLCPQREANKIIAQLDGIASLLAMT